MALSVDYGVTPFLITIPKSDVTLITGTQYQLTVDAYWGLLADYTDNENTMAQPILYSRIPATSSTPSITSINETYYELEFEDGLYSVNIINGNTNIREVEVKNQVSVNTNNTTGFIDPVFLEASLFNEVVVIDVINGVSGTDKTASGGIIGTNQTPSGNLADAKTIADTRGLNTFLVKGNLTVDAGDFSAGYIFKGTSPIGTTLVLDTAANVNNCEFETAQVGGTVDDTNICRQCLIGNVESYDGFFSECGFGGTITLGGVAQTSMIDCFSSVAGTNTPTIDMGGSGSALAIRGYEGGLEIINKTGTDAVSIDLSSGKLILAPTVTNGTISTRGIGKLLNNSTGTAFIINELLNGADVENVHNLLELQSNHHTGTGDVWYWDPYNGDDANDGDHINRAVKTFAQAHTLATDHGHDVIIAVPGNPTGKTVTTENLSITKSYLFLRGPGRSFEINSANDAADAVHIAGDGVELSGMQVSTSATNAEWGVHTQGDFTLLKNLWVYGAVNAVHFENGEYGIADNVKMHHNLGFGLKFSGTCDHVDIIDCHIGSNTLTNVVIDLDASTHEVNFMGGTVIHSSVSGYGIDISATTNSVILHDSVTVFNNFAGDINDLSSNTYYSHQHKAEVTAEKVWSAGTAASIATADSMGEYLYHGIHHLEKTIWIDTEAVPVGDGSQGAPFNDLATGIDYAEAEGITKLKIFSDITLDRSLKNFLIEGVGAPTVDCNGQDLTKSEFSHLTLEGAYLGNIVVQACSLINTFTLNGFFENCVLSSTFIIPDGGIALVKNCSTFTTSMTPPVFNVGTATGTGTLIISGYQGGINIINVNQATDSVRVTDIVGRVVLDASDTNGAISLIGTGKVDLNSAASTLTNLMTDPDNMKDLWHFKGADPDNPAVISGDGVTSSTVTVDSKVLTITPTSITRT